MLAPSDPASRVRSAARHRSPLLRRLAFLLTAVVIAAACGGGGSAEGGANRDRPGQPEPRPTVAPGDACDATDEAVEPEGPSAEAVPLLEGGEQEVAVDAVVYPRPDSDGEPWSQWGQGLVLPDGRFLSAMGDHLGRDGNSYLFVYEPARGRLTRFADVLANVAHDAGDWGYGKIHGQIVQGACAEVYLATYWGSDRGIEFGGTYQGDVLLRLDTDTLELEPLGTPVPEHGIPSLAGSAAAGLVYGEAVVPSPDDARGSKRGAFFAYDAAAGQVVFRADDDRLNGFRNVLVTGDGTAYLSAAGSSLLVYEPGADELARHPEALPGGFLRASTSPAADGTVYGVTQNPERLFALRPDGSIDDLGDAEAYVASLALHPDGTRVFYVPGAHGDSAELGTPLIALDTETGDRTTVVELDALATDELGLTLGGSYSVAVDPSGERVYVSFNAGADPEEPWGEVVLVTVDLP